jgi:hypothetical protein
VGGMDRADQFCGCYRFTIKSQKWWEKTIFFFWLVEVAIVNSLTLSNTGKKERTGRLQTHLAYHKNLIPELIGNVRNRHALKSVRPSSSDIEETLNGKIRLSYRVKKSRQKTAWFGATAK